MSAGDPDAGTDRHRRPGQPERLQHGHAQPLGELVGLARLAEPAEQQRKFVAPEAGGHAAAAGHLDQPPADLDQQFVAGGVPVDVVDLLEVVEVDDQQREVLLLAVASIGPHSEPVEGVGVAELRLGDLAVPRLERLQRPRLRTSRPLPVPASSDSRAL